MGRKKIRPVDSFHINASQMQKETNLLGRVDFVVTDAPIELSYMYDKLYNNSQVLKAVIDEYKIRRGEVIVKNIFIKRSKKYDMRGRYQTEEQAVELDQITKDLMKEFNLDYIEVPTGDIQTIMDYIYES